jgi:hypothetical protein
LFRQLKHEVGREPFQIALDRLNEDFGGDPIKRCEVGVQEDLLSTDGADARYQGVRDLSHGVRIQ